MFIGRTELKLQYFDHQMQRANLLEKTVMLGKIEGRRRRGCQRMRLLDASKILEGFFLPESLRSLEVALGNSGKDFQGEADPWRQTELPFG